MSDGVLAAIIAAGATVFASLLQLRTSFARELATRGMTAAGRRKSRLPFILISAMLIGALIGGFALAQWLHEYERLAHAALERDLRERISELSKTQSELQQEHAGTHDQLESEFRRRVGAEGVVVLATLPACRPPPDSGAAAITTAGAPSSASSLPSATAAVSSGCSETDATPVTLCATVPVSAKITGVELFVRAADAGTPWDNSRAIPGQEIEHSRFAEKLSEAPDSETTRQVCQGFQHWSGAPRVARMIVHYSP